MNLSKIITIGASAIGVFLLMVLLLGIALAASANDNQGESIKTAQTESTATGSVDSGPLSDAVPPLLAGVFKEASSATGTPASLLAAVSYQECNRLWAHSRNHPDIVQVWIEKNLDVDNHGCGTNNYAGAGGPMQFLASTFNGYKTEVSKLTGHTPASRTNVRDAIFGAALKLRGDSGVLKKTNGELPQPSDWTETNIRAAARRYFGACVGKVGATTVYYCDDIVRRWQQYSI
jgi:hypothetical protein